MTDEELLKVYESEYGPNNNTWGDFHIKALRAVFLAGARAQREMPPTEEMLNAAIDAWDAHASGVRELVDVDGTLLEIVKAMQRVAPLAGENNVVQLQHNNGGSDESK